MHLLKKKPQPTEYPRLPKKMNWLNINTMHQRFICAWKQLRVNLFAVCDVFASLYAGSLYLSYCFTTFLAVGIVEIQRILVAVIFYELFCERAVLGDNRKKDDL